MDRWKRGTCEANGIHIHYQRTGGNKLPLVLLHGLTTNGACWNPLARMLENDYDVVMPDARGHGNSAAPNQGYSYDNLAADTFGLIEALKLPAPVLLGHSMGGMTAAVIASRNPKRLHGLILVDPPFLTPQRQQEVYESDVAEQHRHILNRTKEDYLAEMRIRRSHRSNELIELMTQARFQTSMHAFEILKPPNPDYAQLVRTLTIPSLLVIGGIGSVISSELAAELGSCNQCLRIVQIAEAGHGIPFDQPEHLATVVKAFLCSMNA